MLLRDARVAPVKEQKDQKAGIIPMRQVLLAKNDAGLQKLTSWAATEGGY